MTQPTTLVMAAVLIAVVSSFLTYEIQDREWRHWCKYHHACGYDIYTGELGWAVGQEVTP